jgi:TPR repeat protein
LSTEVRANAKLAQAGDIDALVDLADGDEGDGEAYKWLQVAVDFGHDEAAERIEDLLSHSSLHDDDDQHITGNAHLELGMMYSTGSEGLKKDLKLAVHHFEAAVECGYPDSVVGGDEILRDFRETLEGDALEAFESVFPK